MSSEMNKPDWFLFFRSDACIALKMSLKHIFGAGWKQPEHAKGISLGKLVLGNTGCILKPKPYTWDRQVVLKQT